jgi:hypothetical protein
VVLTDVPDNTTIMGVPARIKLPGGRLRKMPWKTMDAKKKEAQISATKAKGSNGANGAKTNGASAAPKTNGAEPQSQPEPQQKINA